MGLFDIFTKPTVKNSRPTLENVILAVKDGDDEIDNGGERSIGGEMLVLDYRDAAGFDSRRRITVDSFDGTYIRAWCYERSAHRKFRVDRVVSLATIDGEVLENLDDILMDTNANALVRVIFGKMGAEEHEAWRAQLPNQISFNEHWLKLMPQLLLLIAVARSDGGTHVKENIAIVEYMKRSFDQSKHELTDRQAKIAARRIEGYFPEEFEIAAAVPALRGLTKAALKTFMACCKSVILADGKMAPEQIKFLKRLSDDIRKERAA